MNMHVVQVITPNRSVVLCAESRRDMQDWIAAVQSSTIRQHQHLVTHLDHSPARLTRGFAAPFPCPLLKVVGLTQAVPIFSYRKLSKILSSSLCAVI